MSDRNEAVAEHLASYEQQVEVGRLGMWLFLATEIMIFGAIFLSIAVYRLIYWEDLAEATHHLKLWIGGINTGLLLTSSLFMALAVVAARRERLGRARGLLLLTALLGLLFLGLKGYEYSLEYQEGLMPGVGPPFPLPSPPQQLFLNIYFAGTGLHALHVTVGISLLLWLNWSLRKRRPHLPPSHERVESVGLYWHLVDIVWVFLYPALYLIGR
jgi:cytochrome c oxidase subunit 3